MEKKRGLSLNSSCALSCDYNTKETHLSKLHAAASTGNVLLIRILLIHEDINKLDGKFRTPLHLACENGQTSAVMLLVERNCIINVCDNEQQTPLIKALQCRHIICASFLLTHDANPNIADMKGNTALHYAVIIPSIEAVSHLREEGAHLDATNMDGFTPLMLAVATNNKEIVQYLLDEGANVNAVERKGRTSLMIACSKGHISLVKMLLQHDVDINMSDNKGRTAVDHAVKNGHNACLDLIFEYRSQKCAKILPALCVSSKMRFPGRCVECGFTLGYHASDKEDSSNKSILAGVEPALKCSEEPPKEKYLAQINAALQAEMCALKQDLGQVQASSQERESRHIKEIELLREKVEELSREVKVREETLTQTVIRHNEQMSALKTEATILSSKVEEKKHQMLKAECERSVQRERDAWLREQDKLNHQLSSMQETNSSLAQQLRTMEAKSNGLNLQLHKTSLGLKEKTFLLEKAQIDLAQIAATIKDLEHTLQKQKEELSKGAVKQESIQERVAQSVSKNLLLPQQLEAQIQSVFSEKTVCDVLDNFTHLYNKLCTDTQGQIHICEKQNKDLQEKFYRAESEKVEWQNTLRQLREELADAGKKLAISEASLERMTQSRDCLEKEKQYLLQKLKLCNSKVSQHDQDTNNLWEEQPKSRSWLETRLAELKSETIHLKEQVESEKRAAKRLVQYHKETASLFEQEISGLKKLLEMAKKKLRCYETGKGHQNSFQEKTENRNLDTKNDEIFQMLQELDKSVPQKPSQGIADVDIGSTRVSTVGTPARSMRIRTLDQDPVYRATKKYLEVIKKNMN